MESPIQTHADQTPTSVDASILITGDLVLKDNWEYPPIGSDLQTLVQRSDIGCVNLEAPLKTGKPIDKNGPTISTLPNTPEVLADLGFDLVCLANNHIMDFGYEGVSRTITACENSGLRTIGTGDSRSESLEPLKIEQNDFQFAFFNVCQHEFGVSSTTQPGTAWIDSPGFSRKIANVSAESDFVFVIVHGGNEQVPIPSIPWQERLRECVAAGADAVLAHHPHVPQGWEVYDGSPIFYSLGNFVFDQTRYAANQWGYAVEIVCDDRRIENTSVVLTRRVGNRVETVKQRDAREAYLEYLQSVSEVIEASPTNPGHWQEVASRLYKGKYRNFFRRVGGGDPSALTRTPLKEIKRNLQIAVARGDLPKQEQLKFLNFIRAESHREAVITGLEVETGTVQDHRTEEIKSRIDQLYKCLRRGIA